MSLIPNLLSRFQSANDKMMANDSYTFLMKELEKLDEKIKEPLSSTDWPRDIPVVTGGGLVESIASIDVNYFTTNSEEDGIISEETTDIPVVQADFSKNTHKTFIFAEYISVGVLEKMKMEQIGRDPETFLNKGLRLHLDKVLDRNVYWGFPKNVTTGLINDANVARASAATGSGGSATWASKTADEILADINKLIADTWASCDCDSSALVNHILVPVTQFGLLVTRKAGDDSGKSILTYVLENNLTTQQGGTLKIFPCKWCVGIGSGNTDRMVGYINDIDKIDFNMTLPLTRMDPEYEKMKIKIPYISQFSQVRFHYYQTARYIDGI